MQIIFLGTGGSVPTIKRRLPAIYLHYKKPMLFDCAEGTQIQLMKAGIRFGRIQDIFISHLHLDHYLGLFGLMKTMQMANKEKKLNIYAPKKFQSIFEAVIKNKNNATVDFLHNDFKIEKEDYKILAYPTDHSVESYGLVFEEKPKIKFYEKKAKELGIKGRLFKEIENKGEIKINGRVIKLNEVSWVRKGRKIVSK